MLRKSAVTHYNQCEPADYIKQLQFYNNTKKTRIERKKEESLTRNVLM